MHPKMQAALIELLKAYETGEGVAGLCPLCEATKEICAETNAGSVCGCCQWTKEGYTAENNYCACSAWLDKQDESYIMGDVRSHPKDYPEIAKKRIDMIRHWLLNDK